MSLDIFQLRGLEMYPLIGQMHWDYRASRILHVACQLEVFTRLTGKQLNADDIAAMLATDATMTEKLLIALCALGLLEKREECYQNSFIAEQYLVEDSPLYQGDIVRHSAQVWDVWNRLEAVVYTGRRNAQLDEIPERTEGQGQQDFILGMHNLSVTGPAQQLAQAVDLTDTETLIDVGGGPGTYSIALCQRFPSLRVTLFDLPATLELAGPVIAKFGLAERITLHPGNWDEDEFGREFGALLMSNVLHGPTSNANMKLAKAYRALRPGGLLLAQDFLLNDQKTGPLLPALFNIMVGAYSISELRAEIEQSGFQDTQLVLAGERGNTLLMARKPE